MQAPQTPAPLDDAVLARLRRELDPDGRLGILARILRTYESSMQGMMVRLENARRDADRHELGEVAHKMKSSSASIGAMALSARCAEVELAVREQRVPNVAAEVEALLAEAARVVVAVRAMLSEPGTPNR